MSVSTIGFRKLNYFDYHKGYLELLSQLTICEANKISYENFCAKLDLINNSNIHVYVLESDITNKIIATATLVLEHKFIHNLSIVGHIEDVVVDTNVRGQNIGSKIMSHLIDVAKSNNCYKVILDCDRDNVEFYKKCGLNEKGVQMGIYFKK